MRTKAIFKRIMLQRLADKRSLVLLFIVPILIITLMYFLMQVPSNVSYRIGLSSDNQQLTTAIKKEESFKVISVKTDNTATMNQKNLDAIIKISDNKVRISFANQSQASTATIKLLIIQICQKEEIATEQAATRAAVAQALKKVASNSAEESKNKIQTALNQTLAAEASQDPAAAANAKVILSRAFSKLESTDTSTTSAVDSSFKLDLPSSHNFDLGMRYNYGSGKSTSFDDMAPAFVGGFVFFFVFLISGISLVNERNSGTLERMLVSPVKRHEIVAGYTVAYGLLAFLQTALIVSFTHWALKMHINGSLFWVFIINFLLALIALLLGLLFSTLAKTEFQFVQFIPVVIVPQFLFSGIINVSTMSRPLQWIAHIMPVYYAIQPLQLVIKRGEGFPIIWPNLIILIVICFLLYFLNTLALKNLRRT